MLVARPRPPGNLSHLQRLIAEIAGVDGEVKRIQRAIANTIVGQMLPPGVVKGGTAIKLRLGGLTSIVAICEYARMRRTTISLPDDLAAALEREARRRRVPVSQVAREAIEARLGWGAEGPREIPFIGAAESQDSKWSAADLDEYLAQHWADEIYRDAFNRDP